jgi:DNA-binding transcriptional regulator YiaG
MAYTHTAKVGRFTVNDGEFCPTRKMKDGTPLITDEELGALELRAAITVLKDIDLVSGAELKFARKALGLRQPELAEHLGVTLETVSRWENGHEAFKQRDQLAVLALLEHVASGGNA